MVSKSTRIAIVEYCLKNPRAKAAAVAEAFGVSRAAVNYARHAAGLTKPRPVLADDEVAEFVSENPAATIKQIAAHFGTPPSTISHRLKKMGLDMAAKEKRSAPDIVALAEEKPWLSVYDIAQAFAVTTAAARRVLVAAGLRGIMRKKRT